MPLEPEEAELAKLFTNTWRYIKFATANQFWMMANDFGLDFARIRHAIAYDYPRAADLPMPGFAAGPCLLKDTMQLAAFNRNNFVLGHSAMLINEGLPLYLVSRLEDRFDLGELTVGILGMAFKGGSDDPRDSLAYKLRKILTLKARETLCTDPYVVDDRFLPARRRAEAGRPAGDRRAARRLRRPGDRQAGRRHVGPDRPRGAGVTPRVSVVIPVYNEGEAIVAVPRPDPARGDAAGGGAHRARHARGHHRPVRPGDRRGATRACARCSTRTARGPANAIRFGIDAARAPVAVVTMADGCDDPRQIDDLARLVDRGVVVAAASRYMPGGQQVGGPRFKRIAVALGGAQPAHLRPGRHPRRHQQLQGVRHRLRPGGRHRVADRLRDRASS